MLCRLVNNHAAVRAAGCSVRYTLTKSCTGAGFGVQALVQGEGALGSLAKFALSFEKNLDLSELQLGN